MDVPGLQLITLNYWRNPGIVSLFDADGNLLGQSEPVHHGGPMLPVNWRGDGQEFSMLSANIAEGGMIDGHFRRVGMFPDDGHPDLAYNVMNLTGDERDEIVVWDTERVWVYTQDRPFTLPDDGVSARLETTHGGPVEYARTAVAGVVAGPGCEANRAGVSSFHRGCCGLTHRTLMR